MALDDAFVRLARQIDAARLTERFLVNTDEIVRLRRHGASELYRICAEFVETVNSRLNVAELELSPAEYTPETFRETGSNLIQISSQGRQVQVVYESPRQLVSTEKFLVPYVLEGEVRAYNQKMLERFDVRSLLIFFCVEEGNAGWRFYDWRSLHTGAVDHSWLVSLMEPLF